MGRIIIMQKREDNRRKGKERNARECRGRGMKNVKELGGEKGREENEIKAKRPVSWSRVLSALNFNSVSTVGSQSRHDSSRLSHVADQLPVTQFPGVRATERCQNDKRTTKGPQGQYWPVLPQ